MSSYIWRATTDPDNDGLGKRTQGSGVEVIEFVANNVLDGKHIHEHTLDWENGFSENERPGIAFSEIQDTGLERLIFSVVGTIENPKTNGVMQTIKEWMIEPKENSVYTKGRFGIELDNFGTAHNCIPTKTGTTNPIRPEQARGLELLKWQWVFTGQWPSKVDFIAELRFNGEKGVSTTSPKYDWTVVHA